MHAHRGNWTPNRRLGSAGAKPLDPSQYELSALPPCQHVEPEAPGVLALPRAPTLMDERSQAAQAAQPLEQGPAIPGVLALPRAPAKPAEQVKQQLQQVEAATPEAA